MNLENTKSVIGFLALIVTINAQTFVCNPPGQSSAAAIPTVSPNYQTRIEVNVLDQNYSMAIDSYIDSDGKRAALTIYSSGQVENVIYSYGTNEVFDIKGRNCTVYTVESNPYNFLFGSFTNSTTGTDKSSVFGAGASFKFPNNAINNGTGNVRGIPADIWSACIQWPNASGNVKVSYYFSSVGWNTSSPQQQVPLRVEVEGMSTLSFIRGSGATIVGPLSHFHHIYDFINYLPVIATDPSTFMTPPQVICLNRKNIKQLPKFAEHFQYKAEVVDSLDSAITNYAIWYDHNFKMVREDTRTVFATSDSQAPVVNSTTEIHDFNTGVRYIMDSTTGCTVKPIDPSDADTSEDVARFQFNGSLVVDIRDPNSFFAFNDNYTYIGQRTVRGVTCDVFSALVSGYVLQGSKVDAIFEYAFLAQGWNELPLYASETDVQNYPVQLVISVPSTTYTRVFNFFEFAEDNITYPTFDVSSCFDEKQKIGFHLIFPGDYNLGFQDQWIAKIYTALVNTMQVFPIRVGGIAITNDDDNIYVNAYVLASSSAAQFEAPTISLERENDKVVKGITMFDECASLCVDNTDFMCEGIQYCQDDGFACRLSKSHQPTKAVLMNATACDFYSRSVKVASKREPILREAYNSLADAVLADNFQVVITGKDGKDLPPFIALSVQLISGELDQMKPVPHMPNAFSYRLEIVVPSSKTVQETYVWYDQSLNLVRYDSRDPESSTPQMVTRIHDFNLGVSYEINQVTQECIVSPISGSGVFDVSTDTLTTSRNGGLTIFMKSPDALFFIDDTYTYIGQGTVRGIECDVYESKRGDFDLEYYNLTTQETVFKYYFQANDWNYISPFSTTITRSQPVQLNIEDKSTGAFLTYNFYDFAEQHFPARFYDASVCYSSDEKKNFMIVFRDQPYHPALDTVSNTFLETALTKLANITFTSPINFQRAQLTFDDDDVYLIVTVLGHTSLINLFTPVMKVDHNTSVSQINALNIDDCASACVYTNSFICNSFDYCDDTTIPNCILGATHSESEGDPLDSAGACTHFSRTENGTTPGLSIQKMYEAITNYVFQNKFQINVTLPNGTIVSYLANDIRDDIRQPNDPAGTAGSDLQRFVVHRSYQLDQSLVMVEHDSVSVTDCATSCIKENTFDCQAFDYQFSLHTCRLSKIHPDELNKTSPGIITNEYSSVYSRFYTSDYTKYDAEVFGTHPDKTLASINTDELCARACNLNSDFVCEAFEICSDGTCQLRKTHILDADPAELTQNPDCIHYSRNHLFDYIYRQNQIIQGYDDSKEQVDNAAMCAQMCSSGEGLPSCASFEVCSPQEGVTQCILSKADPTVQKDLPIVSSTQCSLYTRANPSSNGGNPTAPTKGTSSQVTPSSGTAMPGTTNSGAGLPVTTRTGTATPGTTNSGAVGSGATANSAGACSATPETSSDTGARVGIAFGTLILGLLVGAACMFGFMRYRFGQHGDREGATVLKTWDT